MTAERAERALALLLAAALAVAGLLRLTGLAGTIEFWQRAGFTPFTTRLIGLGELLLAAALLVRPRPRYWASLVVGFVAFVWILGPQYIESWWRQMYLPILTGLVAVGVNRLVARDLDELPDSRA